MSTKLKISGMGKFLLKQNVLTENTSEKRPSRIKNSHDYYFKKLEEELTESITCFRDRTSIILRILFNKDESLRQIDISRLSSLSRAEVSRIIKIIDQKYHLTRNNKDSNKCRLLSAQKLLQDWIDYYSHVYLEYREYKVDKSFFFERLGKFNLGGPKLYNSFQFDEKYVEPIYHFVMKPDLTFEMIEGYFNLRNSGCSDTIIISKPAYKYSFSYGFYPVRIPERNYENYVLSRVQCLLDLSRLVPDARELINKMVSEIAQGLEWNFYPAHGSIK
ncbi:MAG: hypothetical protein CV087_10075 [Candidatus Brocadia sp. WS118]|nr:MAG: hypothetical protein CV087_10075 [Candidatus Brocadia sp. WS118]